jgi:predicted alpha/beta-fold hydrolase
MLDKTSNDSIFQPSMGLKNTHIQTIFSTVGPRKRFISKRFKPYSDAQKEYQLDGGNGIRLIGFHNQATKIRSDKLAILIHGWEGSHNSTYMQSMAMVLLENGIDVFRLNLRDHGDTHHLNKDVFNSTLIDEVINSIEDLQKRLPYQQAHLTGFSLGGNFSLRVAALAHDHDIELASVSAFCPAIHAGRSNTVLNQSANWLYGRYFVRKWKRSLRKKLLHWPHYDFGPQLDTLKTLDEMNLAFVPKYTAFKDIDAYFDAYAISGTKLDHTIAPCYLYFAEDDMIIPVDGVKDLSSNPSIHVTVTKHGGHCGYISNWKGDCWQDERVLSIIQSY